MPWTKNTYPPSMKNLPAEVKNKAVEIANALLEETNMDEGIVIATAISRAKDWAANHGKKTDSGRGKTTDVKQHGEDRIVSPHKDHGWEVKKEAGKRPEIFDTKAEAVKAAKQKAKAANASVTIQRKDGRIGQRVSYNPNNKG